MLFTIDVFEAFGAYLVVASLAAHLKPKTMELFTIVLFRVKNFDSDLNQHIDRRQAGVQVRILAFVFLFPMNCSVLNFVEVGIVLFEQQYTYKTDRTFKKIINLIRLFAPMYKAK